MMNSSRGGQKRSRVRSFDVNQCRLIHIYADDISKNNALYDNPLYKLESQFNHPIDKCVNSITQLQGEYNILTPKLHGGAVPLDAIIYERAKKIVYKQYKKPSAYRSGALVKKYKELGGRYKDDGERKLKRWFAEKWQDIGGKDYPVYRPTKRITSDTPLTASEIDPVDARKKIIEKQIIRGEHNLSKFKKRIISVHRSN